MNLVQNLQAGVLVEDEERRMALVNTEICTAFGVTTPPEQLVGTDCIAAARGAARQMAEPERFVERVEEIIAAGVPVRGEEIAFADGRTFERDYIPVSSGRLEGGHMWLFRDISRRKDGEREAARLRDEAIRAARLKTEFLATMSHEIRTPMNGVLATVELLLDTALEPHQQELARLVRDASLGLLTVVDDALDLSKIEAEKLEPREVDLDVVTVAEGVGDVVLTAARRKGLAVSVYVDPRIPPRLRGDAQWLRQVLVNLAGNAVKFTDTGDVRIRAELVLQGTRLHDRALLGRGHGHRVPGVCARAAVRAVRAARLGRRPAPQRHRPRPRDLPPARAADGRRARRGERARPRLELLVHARAPAAHALAQPPPMRRPGAGSCAC